MSNFQALRVLDGNRPSVSKLPDGRVTFRPSEFGKCIRGLVACLQGHQPEPFKPEQLRTMRQGEIHEKHIAHDLELEVGGKIQRQIRLTLPLADGTMSLDGTCDGVWFADAKEINDSLFEIEKSGPWHDPDIVHYHTRYCDVGLEPTVAAVEIKASDAPMFDEMSKNGPIDGYRVQVSLYWFMIEYTLGVKLTGVWFCVGQRNNGDRHFQFIDQPYYDMEWIEDRARAIVYNAQVEMHCANSVPCDKKQFDCKWWKIHRKDTTHEDNRTKAQKKKMTFEGDLCALALDYQIESEKAETHGLRAEKHKQTLFDTLKIRDLSKAATRGFSMWMGSKSFLDEKALVEENPIIAANYKTVEVKYDVEKMLQDYPNLEGRYTKRGKEFLTIRPNEAELARLKRDVGRGIEPEKLKETTVDSVSESGKKSLLDELGI